MRQHGGRPPHRHQRDQHARVSPAEMATDLVAAQRGDVGDALALLVAEPEQGSA